MKYYIKVGLADGQRIYVDLDHIDDCNKAKETCLKYLHLDAPGILTLISTECQLGTPSTPALGVIILWDGLKGVGRTFKSGTGFK